MKHSGYCRKFGKNMLKIMICAVVIVMFSICMAGCDFETETDNVPSGQVFVVGTDIAREEISDFYYTYSTSTNPPDFQRYYFYVENGKTYFHHEKREGDVFPLTEEYITVSGTFELTDEQWDEFYGYVENGEVTGRSSEGAADGGGVYLYLYWDGDDSEYQVFEFESYAKEESFEEFCIKLSK